MYWYRKRRRRIPSSFTSISCSITVLSRPRERRGRDDRKDGMRGQRGGGRGTRGARGGLPPPGPVPMPPQMMGGPMGGMGGMGPFVPGDFRTPPFPGLEGGLQEEGVLITACKL